MKIYNPYHSIIFIIFIVFSFSCQQYQEIKTEDYSIKIPKLEHSKKYFQNDSSNLFFKNDKNIFSVCVIKKNKFNYISINDCISKELAYFLQENKSDF